jgi:hypothetical protein
MQADRQPIKFEAAWGNPDGYIPYDQRPPQPSWPLRYPNEKAAEADLERLLSPFFTLHRQVRLTETGYAPQIIDYVAELPVGMSLPFFGIEVKRGFEDVKGACDAIQQAMRYRKARMTDRRDALQRFCGDRPPFVFLWPDFRWAVETSWAERHANPDLVRARYLASCAGEARALQLFAARYNIGHVVPSPWWSNDSNTWETGAVLMNGQQQVWTSRWFQGVERGLRAGAERGNDPNRGMRYVE